MQNEFAEPRVALEGQPEQILSLTLVPVGGRTTDEPADRRRRCGARVERDIDINPRCVNIPVENISKRPSARPLLDDQRGEYKTEMLAEPLTHVDQIIAAALETETPACRDRTWRQPALSTRGWRILRGALGARSIFHGRFEHRHFAPLTSIAAAAAVSRRCTGPGT